MTVENQLKKTVGRDAFISEIWERLESKSLYMNDLRRIGKTRIIEKMLSAPPTGWLAAFSDLESTHTVEEFAMDLIQPGPLEREHAVSFANSEILRRRLDCEEVDVCSASIADLVSNVPFYIEKLAARLPRGVRLNPALIEAELEKELRSDNSDWDLDYYRRRVKAVFSQNEKLVLTILDHIARSATSVLTLEEIRQVVSAKMEVDEELLRDHLKLLCMDHYLVRNESNSYSFYLSLIRRWWIVNRSL